jgi:alanine racemase
MDGKFEKVLRPTWAEIDLDAVAFNLAEIRSRVNPGVGVMAVIKANAYGHGIIPLAKKVIEEGVEYLGVATIDEALKLRKAGISKDILVLGSVLKDEAIAAVRNNVTLTLCDGELLTALKHIAEQTGSKPRVHVKIDTGMGRIGVWHERAKDFILEVCSCGSVIVEGMYTHFCSAARDRLVTQFQIEAFEYIIKELSKLGIDLRYKHAANSIAIVDWKDSHLNLVRTGILLYGVYPKEDFRKVFELSPVMALKTRIVFLKDTPPGRSISYGRTYITQRHTRIATIPIGYADGYGRILSNKAEALVNGKLAKVVGIVTMDQTLLDVGDVGDVSVGDEVVLIGRQGGSFIPVEKVAKLAGTIPYEILACITDRVPRIYRA